MTKRKIREELEVLFEKNGFNIDEVATINVLDVDSILYIQLICDIEEKFKFSLPDEFLLFNSLHNVDEIIEVIYNNINI